MQPKTISFPADHQSHDSIVEWWYFNGHLVDEKGKRYSYMDCLFKVDIEKSKIPHLQHLPLKKILRSNRYVYFAHTVLSDITTGKNVKEVQNVSLVSNDSFMRERLFIDYIDPFIVQGFVNNEISEVSSDTFHIKTKNLDLTLASKKPPLLEGGKGYISVRGRGSYYYSLTALETSGSIIVDGERVPVTGTSWMDHQWADVPYSQDKWSWFSFQFDNGTDMMCCEYDDGHGKDCLADILPSSGASLHYKNISMIPGKEAWKSEKTKAEYPLVWDLSIPEYDAKLEARSLVSDQEMIFMAINYWEGPVEVKGMIGNEKVSGVGFMELVGYPSDYNYLLDSGKEVAKKITEFLTKKK